MENRVDLVEDRIDDLENHIINMQQEMRENEKPESFNIAGIAVVCIPLIIFIITLLGLSVDYQSDNNRIRYNSKGLIEISLLVVTTFSGGYIANKYTNERD